MAIFTKKTTRIALVVLLLAVAFRGLSQPAGRYKTDAPYLVILSMDAFRWDYPEIYHTPTLDSIAQHGTKVRSLQPSFPSKTFPNHYTIATGLYPKNHGIVQNLFSDPVLGEYRLSNREAVQNPAFYGGEPIWVSAEKQGIKSACYFWPGSEAPIKGYYPSIWKKFDASVPFEARADSVVSWLEKPVQQRPHLVMWYLEEPDAVSHKYGPESAKTRQTVESIDLLLAHFIEQINRLPIADSVNLVFTADHGMAAISEERSIALEQYINEEWIAAEKGSNPVYLIQPASAVYADSIQNALRAVSDYLDCWPKTEVPAALHYGNNPRIYDLVCAAKPGWSVYWESAQFSNGGTHGYDPRVKDMHAVFYGIGPAFKTNYVHPSIENTNLYELFAAILHLSPAPNDGNFDQIKAMLRTY